MKLSTLIAAAAAGGTLFVLLVPTWNSPQNGTQMGYRASSSIQFDVWNPYALAKNDLPQPLPPGRWGVDDAALADTRPVTEAYRNIQVTKDITAGKFMALQLAITNWVAPREGCGFCHAAKMPDQAAAAPPTATGGFVTDAAITPGSVTPASIIPASATATADMPPQGAELDFASDANPRKTVARIMTGMTRTLNADWSEHVNPSGVTCYTCHRGQNVPASAWYPRQAGDPQPFLARQEPWHEAASTVHDFFPTASDEEWLLQPGPQKIQSYVPLPSPTTGPVDTVVVKRLYEVMMTMSDDIGVNCGYCHNSRAFFDWGQSSPKRWLGLNGIHMTQSINAEILQPLSKTFPQILEYVGQGQPPTVPTQEANPLPGNALANCGTCHYYNPKPLNGVNLVHDYPELVGTKAAAAAPSDSGAKP